MSNRLTDKGREGFLDGSIDWNTDTLKVMLVDAHVATAAMKAVTDASNTTPITLTIASHGFSNGHVVAVGGIVGNAAANGTWVIGNITSDTFDLLTLNGSVASTGSGAYGSGGYAVNLTLGEDLADFEAGRVGTDQTLTNPTVTYGVADADDITYTAVVGSAVEGLLIYQDTGVSGTSRSIFWADGKIQVVCAADAAASATTVFVEALAGGIANATTIVFSNGSTAITTGTANAGDRSIAVAALAAPILAGNTADVMHSGTTFPVTPNGGNISIQWDNGANKIFVL